MLVAFCNPLIDCTVSVEPSYLTKWGLKNDDAILADEKYQPLVDEVTSNPEVFMSTGGAGLNSLVMAQWMMQDTGSTAIVGACGPDSNKQVLENIVGKAGVKCLFQVIEGKSTGCSMILVCEGNRSIVASVAAAAFYSFETWNRPEVISALDQAKAVLITGFFMRTSDRTCLALGCECVYRNLPLAISLSSPTVIDSEAWPALQELFRVAEIIFGNQTEILYLGKKYGLIEESATEENADYKLLVKKLADYGNPTRKRIIVSTMGCLPTLACENGHETVEHEVIKIESSKIVDTNGAGDSFAGGFLAYYMKGASLEKCIAAGCYASYANLQSRGCSVPSFKPEFQ